MYYDYETRNLNFVEMSKYLKGIGIVHHDFMLELHDESLVGVDPFDKHLSSYMQEKVIKECKENLWYFLREIVRVPYIGRADHSLELNRATLAMAFLYLKKVSSWTTAPRMTGKDIMAAALATWDEVCGKHMVGFTSPKINHSRVNLSKSNQMYSRLPEYMKKAAGEKTADAFSAHTSQKGSETPFKDKCEKYSTLIVSDAEFLRFMATYGEVLSNINDQIVIYNSTISDDAKENGVLDILANAVPWSEKFYDDFSIQRITAINKAPKKVVHISFNYKDLGMESKERELRAIFSGSETVDDIFRREFEVQRRPEDEAYLNAKRKKKSSKKK